MITFKKCELKLLYDLIHNLHTIKESIEDNKTMEYKELYILEGKLKDELETYKPEPKYKMFQELCISFNGGHTVSCRIEGINNIILSNGEEKINYYIKKLNGKYGGMNIPEDRLDKLVLGE